MMNLNRVSQFRKVLAQSQSDLFRGRSDVGEDNDRLARANQLRQLRIKTRTGVAGWWIGVAPDWRKNVYDLFFLDTRFGDAAFAADADKKFGEQVKQRSRGGKADPTKTRSAPPSSG